MVQFPCKKGPGNYHCLSLVREFPSESGSGQVNLYARYFKTLNQNLVKFSVSDNISYHSHSHWLLSNFDSFSRLFCELSPKIALRYFVNLSTICTRVIFKKYQRSSEEINPYFADGYCDQYRDMKKKTHWKVTETWRELSNEYRHDRVLDNHLKSLRPRYLEESSHSIGRVKCCKVKVQGWHTSGGRETNGPLACRLCQNGYASWLQDRTPAEPPWTPLLASWHPSGCQIIPQLAGCLGLIKKPKRFGPNPQFVSCNSLEKIG